MKTSKKVISLLLSLIMVMTTFVVAVPQLTIEAEAQFETINGITQTRIVPDGTYQSVYASYAAAYLNGYSEPTELVIPGLTQDDNYVVQGITYYPEKNWVLITAYHNSDSPQPSMVYCIDVATGDFVAMFSFKNVDGSANTDHGGGIAISENNIYYSCGDLDRSIAYAPLSAIEGIENDITKYREVQLVAEQTFYETGSVADGSKTAYTAYCCYDQGVLWTGNFYDKGVAGIIAADYDVKAHNDYPSMVWGYELSGANSAEEWANLTSGAVGSQGNPSYVVALPSDIKDVQYATVDDGRLYLSRSFGTGTETCQNVGMEPYSQLSIADIDLSVNGSGTITFTTDANGNTRTVNNAYIVPSLQTFDFMPMAEGLCVIDDYIYMTFESATYKYYEDAGIMGNCDVPVDVVWKIDQYGLLGHERPDAKPVTAYEKVKDVSEISSTDEYIVVYESEMKAEGNQNNILYALNSYGGYQGGRIPKTDSGTVVSTMDSMGMIGHQITDYHTYMNTNGEEFLILGDAVSNDVPNIRWNLIGAGTGAMRFHSVDLYNAEYSYLYFDQRLMYMSTENNTNLNDIVLVNKTVDGITYPGEFFIYNSANSSYLWCNDGSDESIMTAYNDYYQIGDTTHKYYGQTEIPGTFHADAFKTASGDASGNQSSFGSSTYRMTTYSGEATNSRAASASADPYELATFSIYKRITTDPNAMGGTGLETDLKAELQPDGTYTINLGTYATSGAHKYLGESGYPTDFMFVLDASGSMTNNNDYVTYQSEGKKPISRGMANDREGYYVWVDYATDADGNRIEVNQFALIDGHHGDIDDSWGIDHRYWCTADLQDGSGYEYMIDADGTFKTSRSLLSDAALPKKADGTVTQSLTVYRKRTTTRLQGMKDTVNNFISKIDANAQTYNIEHRVGITTFGSDSDESYLNTGIYSTLSGTAMNTYGADLSAHYAAAFYPSNHSNLKTIVNNIDTTIDDPDTFANIGMEMAVNAYAHQSPAYGGAGDRYYSDFTDSEGIFHEKNANAVVIFLTDGCPGYGGSDSATATTVANAAIPSAQAIKGAGGVVYSVQISNATMDGFDMSAYMNGVSSNYPSATSLTSLGTKGSSDYYVKAATDGTVDVNMVLNGVFEHIENNYIDVGTAVTLDEDSIVRQKLGSNFKLTSESNVLLTTSTVTEDVLGNVVFDGNTAATGVTYSKDVTNNTIQVTNFDYSSNYYAKNAKEGKRLNIIIDNVLPVDTDEDTMNISNATYTAIYENPDNLSANKKFKGYPNAAFEIPEYTYVLDYGMQMLDTDINGTLCSVSNDLSKQTTYTTSAVNGMLNIDTATAGNGKVNQNLIYKINPTQKADKGYALIQRNDGTYDWFRINVVPASNVLFEENYVVDKVENSDSWEKVGESVNTRQSLTDDETDVYGYDAVYATTTNDHSNGSAIKTSVKADAKRSTVKSFDFIGEGFDLISACGANTGIMIVKVTGGNLTNPRAFIVDTYYSGEHINDSGLLCQTPIVNFTGDYGTYTVETTAAYLSTAKALQSKVIGSKSNGKFDATTGVPVSEADAKALLAELGMTDLANADLELVWFDDNSVLNGGSGAAGNINTRGARADGRAAKPLDCYIDGFRIYNPLDVDSSKYIATEQIPQYINVINSLKNNQIGTDTTAVDGIAYVEKALEGLAFANYNQVGPQNELYLKGGITGNALVLKVQLSNTSEVHLGLRAVNGTATVKIGGTEFVINGPTEMYYDVTDCLDIDQNTGMATITIQNTGTGLLAVNNIKMTQQGTIATLEESDLSEASTLMMKAPVRANVVDGVVTPIVEDTNNDADVDNGTDNDTDNDNTGDAGSGTGSGTGSSNLSFIEQLIAKIMEILSSIFKFLPVGGVA